VASAPELYTVGHSTHAIEAFLALLEGAGVEAIADVRRYPGSRRNPQFAAAALRASLAEAGRDYHELGEELGGRRRPAKGSPNGGWRVEQFRGYADHMASAVFADGLERLERIAAARPTAVMCAEGDWHRCHRRMVADAMLVRGWHVAHLRPGGELEAHELTGFAVVAGERITYPPGAGRTQEALET
jgi:uncharacterized protein (DUF488 family)